MKYLLLSILFITSCCTLDCSNRAAALDVHYEAKGIHTLIAVCPVANGEHHAYILKGDEIIDAWSEEIVDRSLQGCIIFDYPEVLKPYMDQATWEKEWSFK